MSGQIERRVSIPNQQGLHARPSAMIVKCAASFSAEIWIRNQTNGMEADAKKLMEVMMLAAPQGTELVIEAQGPDAATAIESLVDLVSRGFDES